MASIEDLEETYRRIYRRLTLGVFILYGVVVVLAVTVLLGNPIKSSASRMGGTRPWRR